MIRIFTYDFENYCNLKPLEPLPARASEIAPNVYRLPELSTTPGELRTSGADLVRFADWRGVSSTDLHVKRRWQTYYNVRTLPRQGAGA